MRILASVLLGAIALLCAFALSGCITAFAPASDPCTVDPKDPTGIRRCSAENMRASDAWEQKRRDYMKN